MSKRWEFVGNVVVDTGQIVIADPCYLKHVPDMLRVLDHQPIKFTGRCAAAGKPGAGVATRTGAGDGTYPVFVRKDDRGMSLELVVCFTKKTESRMRAKVAS